MSARSLFFRALFSSPPLSTAITLLLQRPSFFDPHHSKRHFVSSFPSQSFFFSPYPIGQFFSSSDSGESCVKSARSCRIFSVHIRRSLCFALSSQEIRELLPTFFAGPMRRGGAVQAASSDAAAALLRSRRLRRLRFLAFSGGAALGWRGVQASKLIFRGRVRTERRRLRLEIRARYGSSSVLRPRLPYRSLNWAFHVECK